MSLLHQNASPGLLRAVRLLVFGVWLIKTAQDSLAPLSILPFSVFEPVGFLAVLPLRVTEALLQPGALSALRLATLLSLGAVLLMTLMRRGTAPVALLACACLTMEQALARGFSGHTDHKDLVWLYAAYLLAVLPLVDALAKRRGPARPVTLEGIPVVAILATLCVTYAFVGIHRLAYGGVEVFTSGSMTFWALRNSYQVTEPAWGLGRMLLEQPLVARALNAGFPVVTAFEVLAPLCLIWRAFRPAFLLVMVPFHVLSWMFMEVFFWKSLLLYGLLVAPPAANEVSA